MKQFASHYLYYGQSLRMHCIRLDGTGCIERVFPFVEEIASTVFVDGLVFPIRVNQSVDASLLLNALQCMQAEQPTASAFELIAQLSELAPIDYADPVLLFRLHGCDFSSPKFGTDNGCRYGYIERL